MLQCVMQLHYIIILLMRGSSILRTQSLFRVEVLGFTQRYSIELVRNFSICCFPPECKYLWYVYIGSDGTPSVNIYGMCALVLMVPLV